MLNELLLRDAPIREPFKTQWSDDPTESGLPSDVVDPGIRDDDYSKEEHRRQKRGYFLDLGRFPVFVDIITEYLKARPVLLQELITSLVDSNLDTSDERLAHLFVENMLKDVSKETLEFLEANLKIFIYKDPKIGATQDPFIYQRVMGDIE